MKKKLYPAVIILLSLLCATAYGQGCVAVRNMSSSCSMSFDSAITKGSWQFSMNYRYFHSYKHFVGKEEQKHRVEEGTNVINDDHSILLGGLYALNKHWSFAAIIPVVYINRSSLYEHMGNGGDRYSSHSQGLGDMRLAAYYSVIPQTVKGNLTIGLGVKLPTGNFNYHDDFHKKEGLKSLPVDESIQPGDGGFGITTEIDFSQRIARNLQLYASGLYLFSPSNTNGTIVRNAKVNDIPMSDEMSVADQFLLRLGARYAIHHFQFSLGGRFEGVAVKDVFGESDGFRRPGYILSAEPAAYYEVKRHTFGLNVPIALVRNRTQSLLDKKATEITGQYKHGDAAFADYLISLSYAFRL